MTRIRPWASLCPCTGGLGDAFWRLLAKVASPFIELSVELLFERDLTAPVGPESAKIEIAIVEAAEADLDQIARLYSSDSYLFLGNTPAKPAGRHRHGAAPSHDIAALSASDIEPYRERLRRGERCFVALVGSEIAHVNWLCFKLGEALPGRPIVLRPGEVYTTDAFTVEIFRGKNIHAAVLSEMLRCAQRLGCYRALTLTRRNRRDSYKIFPRLGWSVMGTALSVLPRGREVPFIVRLSGRIDPLLR